MRARPSAGHATLSALTSFIPEQALRRDQMANSSFETFKQGGKAIDEAAEKTGQQADGVYEQAKSRGFRRL